LIAGFVLGAVWGSLFTQFGASWRWIYWSMTIVAALYGIAAILIVPNELNGRAGGSFDFLGSFIGVSALILIFFSLKYFPRFERQLTKALAQLSDGTSLIHTSY